MNILDSLNAVAQQYASLIFLGLAALVASANLLSLLFSWIKGSAKADERAIPVAEVVPQAQARPWQVSSSLSGEMCFMATPKLDGPEPMVHILAECNGHGIQFDMHPAGARVVAFRLLDALDAIEDCQEDSQEDE